MLVAHCTALKSAWPYRQSQRRAAGSFGTPIGPRWASIYSSGPAATGFSTHHPSKRQSVRPWMFSEHRGDELVTASKFVADHSDTYQVKRLCEIVELERSSYYAWKSAEPARAARTEADAQRAEQIRVIHAEDNTSGAPRITDELNDSVAADEKVNRKRAVWVGLTHRDRAP